MKILNLYCSNTGNTAKVAMQIRDAALVQDCGMNYYHWKSSTAFISSIYYRAPAGGR